MDNINVTIICLLLVVFIFGCTTTDTRVKQSGEDYTKNIKQNIVQDGEIIAFLDAVDNFEISAAEQVMNKLTNNEVISFAKYMIDEHSQNLNETQKLSEKNGVQAYETSKIRTLKADNEMTLAHLNSLKGYDLEKSYIDTMVKGHEDVLKEIDIFLERVHNPALKSHLQNTRQHIKMHLAKAEQHKTELRKARKT